MLKPWVDRPVILNRFKYTNDVASRLRVDQWRKARRQRVGGVRRAGYGERESATGWRLYRFIVNISFILKQTKREVI